MNRRRAVAASVLIASGLGWWLVDSMASPKGTLNPDLKLRAKTALRVLRGESVIFRVHLTPNSGFNSVVPGGRLNFISNHIETRVRVL